MSGGKTLVFIHGVGGPEADDSWLNVLNDALAQHRFPRFKAGVDQVIAPPYLNEMRLGSTKDLPPWTWRRPEDKQYLEAKLRFAERCDSLASVLQDAGQTDEPGFSRLPRNLGDVITDVVITQWEDVRTYKNSRPARASALAAVLRSLPTRGTITLIGYSLGSVVAQQLLVRLPAELRVDLLVTIGSPLSIRGFGDAELTEQFPYDRVGSWLNLYDPMDPVTRGRGLASRFPDVIDFQVACATGHEVAGYLSQPALAGVVGHVVFDGAPRPAPSAGKDPVPRRSLARDFGAAWLPTLLGHAYCASLSATYPADKWRAKMNLDEARRIIAARTIDQAERALAADRTIADTERQALRGRPTLDDLLDHASEHLRGILDLEDIVPFLVALASASPVAPFDIEFAKAHQQRALARLLKSACRGVHSKADDIATAILESINIGRAVVKPESTGSGWLVWLGLGVLAATGVGLLAAIPAGLAGAAAITATLATFGPGGMVGGMVTLAALTGAGSAFVTGGLATQARAERDPAVVIGVVADSLAKQPVDALRSTVASLLSVLEAQRKLDLQVSYSAVMALLARTHDLVSVEAALHVKLAPDRSATKEWIERRRILSRAIDWMLEHSWPDGVRPRMLE